MIKALLIGLITFMTVGITLEKNILNRLGMDENILIITLIAFVSAA